MEEWGDWVVEDSDPAEMVRQMRDVLADRQRNHEEKTEALSLLTNLADEASMEVLRWYSQHADPGMEIASMLALMEAGRLNQPPHLDAWHEAVLEKIHEVGEQLETNAIFPDRHQFREALTHALRADAWQVDEGGRALLLYDGHLVDMVRLELVVNSQVLVGFWDRADEEAAFSDDSVEDEEEMEPFDHFYAILRTANLPWGIHVDLSGPGILTDLVQNMELDRGRPKVEYVLSLPQH